VRADFQVGPYHVYRRPFLGEFVAAASGWFDLAVWSSASASYVDEVVQNVFGVPNALRFVWACDRCTRRYHPELQEPYYAKNLSKLRKLGFALERILMVDDSPEKLAQHYGNHIRVSPFTGNESDTELRDLLPFLESLRTIENVRQVEKRFWRQHRPPGRPPI
jgi:TFIIF-interacting CTD phosphatase-like protein